MLIPILSTPYHVHHHELANPWLVRPSRWYTYHIPQVTRTYSKKGLLTDADKGLYMCRQVELGRTRPRAGRSQMKGFTWSSRGWVACDGGTAKMGRRCSGQYSPPDNTAPAQPIEALMEGRFCRGYVWTAGMRQDTRHALNHLSTLSTVERDGEELLRKRGPVFFLRIFRCFWAH